MANSVDPDQTAPIGAVCSGSTLFASILNLSVMLGNYLQQTTFSYAFFLGGLRVNIGLIWGTEESQSKGQCPLKFSPSKSTFISLFSYTLNIQTPLITPH